MQRKENAIRKLHKILLPANVGVAASRLVLIFLRTRIGPPGDTLDRGLSQSLAWVNHLLRLPPRDDAGVEVMFAAFAVGLSALLLWLSGLLLRFLRALGKERAADWILNPLGGVLAFGAGPATWLCWSYPVALYGGEWWATNVWCGLVLEMAVLWGALNLLGRMPIALRYTLPFLILHYGFWGYLTWPRSFDSPLAPFLAVVAPCSGLAWALYVRCRREVSVVT